MQHVIVDWNAFQNCWSTRPGSDLLNLARRQLTNSLVLKLTRIQSAAKGSDDNNQIIPRPRDEQHPRAEEWLAAWVSS